MPPVLKDWIRQFQKTELSNLQYEIHSMKSKTKVKLRLSPWSIVRGWIIKIMFHLGLYWKISPQDSENFSVRFKVHNMSANIVIALWIHPVYTVSGRRAYTSKCTAVAVCIAPKGVAMRNPCNGSLSREFMHVAGWHRKPGYFWPLFRERQAFLTPLKCLSAVSRLTTAMKYGSPPFHNPRHFRDIVLTLFDALLHDDFRECNRLNDNHFSPV